MTKVSQLHHAKIENDLDLDTYHADTNSIDALSLPREIDVENMCSVNWELVAAVLTGLGTIVIGIGTFMIGRGAMLSIPQELRRSRSVGPDKETTYAYRQLIKGAIRKVESEDITNPGRSGFPGNFPQFMPILLRLCPEIRNEETALVMINDLMEHDMIDYVQGAPDGSAVLRTIKWDKKLNRYHVDSFIR